MKVLVTGSSGLIGSEAVAHFDAQGHAVHGVDNNMRRTFFGEKGDTSWNLARLKSATKNFTHHEIDIRDREALDALFAANPFDMVIHCAAQPSHDKACEIPYLDFEVNAGGTLNLLEATRRHSPEAVFIHMSTNKVYGDGPNRIERIELPTRYEYEDEGFRAGIAEDFPIDRCLHTLFGTSKTSADLIAQEYGRYFGMKVGVFRGGCLTGPSHSGVQLHGFLNYLVKVVVWGEPYTVFGYQGKQVRDNIHSHDVVMAFEAFAANPRPGEVYNLGGGPGNSISMLEAIERIEAAAGRKLSWEYAESNRIGDHIVYYSNLAKLRRDLKGWDISIGLDRIIEEMVAAEQARAKAAGAI